MAAGAAQTDVPGGVARLPAAGHALGERVERGVVVPDREERGAVRVGTRAGGAAGTGAEQAPEAQTGHAAEADAVGAQAGHRAHEPVFAHEVERGDAGHGASMPGDAVACAA